MSQKVLKCKEKKEREERERIMDRNKRE